ncbi:MAG: HAD-IIIA family hydrolase [Acetobacteraceae bacterium]|nr:HAD-IIIA family hydrolase [Acetobacteraceae bacterium]
MRNATYRQAAILVGGLGTRLGEATRATPKPMVAVGGRPFLAWLLRELCRFGVEEVVLLAGHLSDTLRQGVAAIAETLPRPLRLVCSDEPVRAGTGGALFHASHLLDARFILCNGDSWFDGNLAAALAAAAADPDEVVARMIVRQVPDAARYGVVSLDGAVVRGFAERGDAGGGAINTGIYLLDRRVLDTLAPVCSLEREVLPALAARGLVRATRGEGHFIDIGIPEDLARAQHEIPRTLRRGALFLDRDGTINIDHGWVGSRDRFEWIAGAQQAIAAATAAGLHVFVVTNQSGVARGRYDEAAVQALHGWMAEMVRRAGGTIDDIRYAPHHPDFGPPAPAHRADWRKPGAGMLHDLIRRWEVDPARSLLVGDQPSDIAAATAAGIAGHRFPGGDLAAFIAPLLPPGGPRS